MSRACSFLLVALLCGIGTAPAAEPVTRSRLVGGYRRQGSTFFVDLHLAASGAYRLRMTGDMGANEPNHGTWSLRPGDKVRLRGADAESRRIARLFGPFSVLPDGEDGLMLVGDKELVRYSQPKAAAFRRLPPATAATPAT